MVRRHLGLVTLLMCSCAPALAAPGPIDYAVELGSSYQYQSNPARLPESSSSEIHGSGILVNSVGLGLRVPVLSDDTRLELGGTLADARYSDNAPLDHSPRNLQSTFYWRATPLVSGRLDYNYQSQLSPYMERTYPDRDMEVQDHKAAEVGLNITDRWTFPLLDVFQDGTRFDQQINRTLYDSSSRGWQLSGRYAGYGSSYIQAGVKQTKVDYYNRTDDLISTIDNRYIDNQLFTQGMWEYSPKTTFNAQMGLIKRNYQHLTGRDTRLFNFQGNATWDYSPKTRFVLNLWHRPYADDDDQTVLYSMQTGGGIGVVWRPTVKTAVTAFVDHSIQKNTAYTGGSDETLQVEGYGARFAWQSTRRLTWIVDLYRDHQSGAQSTDTYNQNYVRIGVQYAFGSPHHEDLVKLMDPVECAWERPDLSMCQGPIADN